MFGHFNQDELTVAVNDRLTTYRQEAALQRQLPRYSIRHHLAQQLRSWAEALEPSRGFSAAKLATWFWKTRAASKKRKWFECKPHTGGSHV